MSRGIFDVFSKKTVREIRSRGVFAKTALYSLFV